MWTCPRFRAKPGEPVLCPQSYLYPISQRTAFWTCLPPSHGCGNALLKVRQCFNALQYLGVHHVKRTFFKPEFKMTFCPAVNHHGLLEKCARFSRESLCCMNWETTFEKFGWISEVNFLDYPLTRTEYGAGCSITTCARAEFSVNVCILEENPVKHPYRWIRCLSLKLSLPIQRVDLCRCWPYFCLNQELWQTSTYSGVEVAVSPRG